MIQKPWKEAYYYHKSSLILLLLSIIFEGRKYHHHLIIGICQMSFKVCAKYCWNIADQLKGVYIIWKKFVSYFNI